MKSNPPTSAMTPDILSKRYTYTTLLGEGATGKTYRARDKLMGYDVAIKALRFHSNLKTHELFRREAATLKSIRLQGVPMCHDIVENPDDISFKILSMANRYKVSSTYAKICLTQKT